MVSQTLSTWQVFSWQTLKVLRKLQGHVMPVTCLAASPDSRHAPRFPGLAGFV